MPADEFAEHRSRLAKQAKAAGDKVLAASIGKLRKPVLAAALVNELVRAEPAELQELTELGAQMRDAHRQLRGPELRALSEQRQHLLQRLTDLVRDTAEQDGRSVTEPVLAQVRGTFEAAIADEGAEAAVLSGRLTTVLSYTGFGEVDVTDAVAAPVRRRHLKSVPDRAAPAEAADATADSHNGKSASAGTKAPPGKAASSKAASSKDVSSKAAGKSSTGRAAALSSSADEAHERRRQRHQEQLRRAEPSMPKRSGRWNGRRRRLSAPSNCTRRPPPGWSSCARNSNRPRRRRGGQVRPAGPRNGPSRPPTRRPTGRQAPSRPPATNWPTSSAAQPTTNWPTSSAAQPTTSCQPGQPSNASCRDWATSRPAESQISKSSSWYPSIRYLVLTRQASQPGAGRARTCTVSSMVVVT